MLNIDFKLCQCNCERTRKLKINFIWLRVNLWSYWFTAEIKQWRRNVQRKKNVLHCFNHLCSVHGKFLEQFYCTTTWSEINDGHSYKCIKIVEIEIQVFAFLTQICMHLRVRSESIFSSRQLTLSLV